MSEGSLIDAPERVLSTLNRDGSRRWLFPRLSPGRFLDQRRVVGYGLILVYNVLPWITINGKPAIFLDLPRREFTFFGTTFLPTDTLLLMLFMAAVFVAIFLITALFGRLWCGWGCPQTVYMELVYRPIERLFDGSPDARRRGSSGAGGVRKALKYVAFFIVSLHLAHTFLAYFVGPENLLQWTTQSPFEHPKSFVIVMAVTALMMFDFCIFREQTCILACPYGRFQSVMLDRSSLIISYDEQRGEPRGKKRRAKSDDVALPQFGDCIDCKMCVVTCPTGIDIREGLQMECIGCAQCIDACDAVMTKIGRAIGLIRYSSQEAMAGTDEHLLRPRVVIYPLILTVIVIAFIVVLIGRDPADIKILRGSDRPYVTLAEGEIENPVRIKIVNRTQDERHYHFDVEGLTGARLIVDQPEVTLGAGATQTTRVSIVVPADSFDMGRAVVTVLVLDDEGFTARRRHRIQGPWGRSSSEAAPDEGDES